MKRTQLLLLLAISLCSNMLRGQAFITTPDTIAACIGDTIVFNVLANDIGDDAVLVDFSDVPGPGSFSFTPDGFFTFIPSPDDFNSFYEINYLVCEEDEFDDCEVEQVTFYLQAYSDCVWPGDADVNGTANHFDLLNIGLYYGDAGPDRFDEDNSWDATYADNWDDVPAFPGSLPKFADCNGNGIVDAADTISINTNYNFVHALRTDDAAVVDAPPLFIDIPFDTIPYDSTVVLPIILGSEEFPATDIYGLAFSFEYNVDLIVPGTIDIQFNEGWLGTEATNLFAMRYAPVPGIMDVGVSRNTHTPASGTGQIGTVSFVMESNLAGKTELLTAENLELCVSPLYRAVDEMGNEITLAPGCDSVTVADGGDTIEYVIDLLIFPNPAVTFARLKILDIEPTDATVEIKNMFGTTVRTIYINDNVQTKIKVSNLPNGTYTAFVTLPYAVASESFVVMH